MADAFLDADALRAASFVRHVELHDTLGSTNDRAAELARDETIELPALIVARLQTAGRGRGQHKWWSADGALTFSLLLEPSVLGISINNWPQLSLATAVAVCDALSHELRATTQRAGASPPPSKSIKQTDASAKLHSHQNKFPHGLEDEPARSEPPRLGIKWPNDVLIYNDKIAGILIESPGGYVPASNRLIIGIGTNVNNSWSTAPADLVKRGIALCDVTGHPLDIQAVLIALLCALEIRLDQVAANDRTLHHAWQNHCWLTNRDAVVEVHDRTVTGRCVGIAEDGALLLDVNRSIERFYSGSVTVRE